MDKEELKRIEKSVFQFDIAKKIDGNTTNDDEINEKYNSDEFYPVDGEIIRGCDHLSAYLEAYMSIRFGIQSEQLQQGYHNLFQRYQNKVIAGIDFGQLFDYFRL